jgi:ribosomal-protein-serine acetyltransferase
VFTFPLGEQRCLRLLDDVDAEALYEVVTANRAYLARWMPWAAAQTLEGTREFIRTSRKQLADNAGFQSAIVDADQIIGVIGYHRLDWENRSTTIGFWIAERSQGHGTVTSAARALVNHALEHWKLNRVDVRCGVDNPRSRSIPERLGFKQEGVLREAERVGDRYVDHVVYAILATDWPGS